MLKFLLTIALIFFSASATPESFIANTAVQLPKTMTVDEVRDIFTLKTYKSPTGVGLQVFLLPRESLTTWQFMMETLGVTPSSYFYMLEIAASTGKEHLPITVESEARMIISVGATSGGVGYVRNPSLVEQFNTIQVITIKK